MSEAETLGGDQGGGAARGWGWGASSYLDIASTSVVHDHVHVLIVLEHVLRVTDERVAELREHPPLSEDLGSHLSLAGLLLAHDFDCIDGALVLEDVVGNLERRHDISKPSLAETRPQGKMSAVDSVVVDRKPDDSTGNARTAAHLAFKSSEELGRSWWRSESKLAKIDQR